MLTGIAVVIALSSLVALFWYWKLQSSQGPVENPPQVLVVEGHIGDSALQVNGEYILLPEKVNDQPTWARHVLGSTPASYILMSVCGAWLISESPNGDGNTCRGWAYAFSCYSRSDPGPWACTGSWVVFSGNRWLKDTMMAVTAGRPAVSENCSKEDEMRLANQVADFDIVIPWVNGSDPKWLQERQHICEDFQWNWMWPDALRHSPRVKECLRESSSRKRDGSCFLKFLESQCKSRTKSIGDHDELRYLLRSLDAHLQWHKGRIIVVLPGSQMPRWLHSGGRVQVMAQEDLVREAMASRHFQPKYGYAPARLFNDYPVEVALAFLPNASRHILLVQDDVFLGRPVGPCDLFTQPPSGLRLFARPYIGVGDVVKDPYSHIFAHMQAHTGKLFTKSLSNTKVKSPYYRPNHAPHLLHLATLQAIWEKWPVELSAALDSPIRHPRLVDLVGLHHSDFAHRSKSARVPKTHRKNTNYKSASESDASCSSDLSLACSLSSGGDGDDASVLEALSEDLGEASRVIDVREFTDSLQPIKYRKTLMIEPESLDEWRDEVHGMRPGKDILPLFINIQDGGVDAETDDTVSKQLDCEREKWLLQLFPTPSKAEDRGMPPSQCVNITVDDGASEKVLPVANLTYGTDPFPIAAGLIRSDMPNVKLFAPVVIVVAYHQTGTYTSRALADAIAGALQGPPHVILNGKFLSWVNRFPAKGDPSRWYNWSLRSAMNLDNLDKMLPFANKEKQGSVFSCTEPLPMEQLTRSLVVHFVRHPIDTIISAYHHHLGSDEWWTEQRAACNFCSEPDRKLLFQRCKFDCNYKELLSMHNEEDGLRLEFVHMRLSITTMLINMQTWLNEPHVLPLSLYQLQVNFNQTIKCIADFLGMKAKVRGRFIQNAFKSQSLAELQHILVSSRTVHNISAMRETLLRSNLFGDQLTVLSQLHDSILERSSQLYGCPSIKSIPS